MSDGPGRKPTVSDDEILDVFRNSSDPVLTASEVAEELSLSRRGAYKRLRNLAEQDILESKQVGSSSKVWWFPKTLCTS